VIPFQFHVCTQFPGINDFLKIAQIVPSDCEALSEIAVKSYISNTVLSTSQ